MTKPSLGAGKSSIFIGLISFVVLVAAGIWWAAPDGARLGGSWEHFTTLSPSTYLLLAALSIALIAAEAVRFIVIGLAFGVKMPVRAGLDAAIASNFFSWITPGAFLGEPAAVLFMKRRGVPLDAAVIIATVKFVTGFAVIMAAAIPLQLAGYGPVLKPWIVIPVVVLFAIAIGVAFLVRGKIAGVIRRSVARLGVFRSRGGLVSLIPVLLSHGVYYAAFISILVVLASAFGASDIPRVSATATVYLGFLYAMPTPGASGAGEAAGDSFFGELIPGGDGFTVVLLFRALTFYLHIAIGLVYLLPSWITPSSPSVAP